MNGLPAAAVPQGQWVESGGGADRKAPPPAAMEMRSRIGSQKGPFSATHYERRFGIHGNNGAFLYRHFDADNRLLYVGQTYNLMTRTQGHLCGSWWFHHVDRIEWTDMPGADLKRIELDAIYDEKPLCNILGANPDATVMRVRYADHAPCPLCLEEAAAA